jgi:phosphoribosylformimino-5-aminoimidazole carboxamide ribotide isomerase
MIELIPAIDIIGGKCVRLVQGSYRQKKVYADRPVEVALAFEDLGIRRLHLVDLDGARAGRVVNLDILRSIADHTSLIIDFGGGIKSDADIQSAFEAGAAMVTAGSIAAIDRGTVIKWLEHYGPERIILGTDTREGKISIHAWQEDTVLDVFDFIEGYQGLGITRLICTDIVRDGMLGGPALDLYKALRERFPALYIIASGGIAGMEDIRALDRAGIHGVIFGKAYYEGKITSPEIKKILNER